MITGFDCNRARRVIQHDFASTAGRCLCAPTCRQKHDTVIYLQITPDHLDSLRIEPCRLKNGSPLHLDNVRRRLGRKGGRGDLTRLQFQLRSGIHAKLIAPNDFPDYEALARPARHTLGLVASIAASSSFSLYLPANQLSKQLLGACIEAVERSSVLTEQELRSYQRAVDLQRLYRGKGGKVLLTGDYDGSSRPETDSCATTVDFDIVPRHQGLPPVYGECVDEGVKPGALLDDAIESPFVDCAPPEYSETEQPGNMQPGPKRVRQCGNEDALLHPSSKRVLSRGSCNTITETAATKKARRLEANPRPEFDDADGDGNVLLRNLMRRLEQQEEQIQELRQQQQDEQLRQECQIKQLQEEIFKLRKQNADLEGRSSKVENICDSLEHGQGLAQEDLENLHVHIDELEELVREQISDMSEEHLGDLMRERLGDLAQEHVGDLVSKYMDALDGGNLAGPLGEYVRHTVTTQMAKMKAKIREALQV
ncbi:hypothetical protein Cob_v013208 [Colletotrichum orbiculare MAFF 240422]|uniref:Uncharacterized protein n=1 Tax=Colletotrichum orbiculare (strain 104-T / ATCC 96160 / CBS 514.97 / LARS 414 / MAFF 240422) TaxID=1213857 RepID=A0A484F7K6_COLOR|nr:hypothetical protein Cob_v013208 [Colletotrichum orbiculare MAFF 240422]